MAFFRHCSARVGIAELDALRKQVPEVPVPKTMRHPSMLRGPSTRVCSKSIVIALHTTPLTLYVSNAWPLPTLSGAAVPGDACAADE